VHTPAIAPKARQIVQEGPSGRAVDLPLPRIAKAATDSEKDVLERFFEASELRAGRNYVSEIREQPRGRYARVAGRIDLETYRQYEVGAFNWIYGVLSDDWKAVAVVFIQQMREESKYDPIQWGKFLTAEDGEECARGAAITSYRLLALTLKAAYSEFAKWYKIQEEAKIHGRAINGDQARERLTRSDLVMPRIRQIAAQTRQKAPHHVKG
jgi:hypothetical protein